MNNIFHIDLQIKSEPEKTADFFIALYKFKKKHGKIPPTLFPLDGIELNKATTTLLQPSKEELDELLGPASFDHEESMTSAPVGVVTG